MKKAPTILVVEDDHALRDIIIWSLREENYEVLFAEDGQHGLELVEKADLVLLNLKLPKVDGEEFIEKVRNAGNYVPIIVVTGAMDRKEGTKKFQKYKIVDFIEKPFDREQITSRIEEAFKVVDDVQTLDEASHTITSFVRKHTK